MSIRREELVLNTVFIGAIVVALLLAGCAERPINTCPAPVAYSQGFLDQAADQLDALPPGSPIGQMLVDYAQERAALRACRS